MGIDDAERLPGHEWVVFGERSIYESRWVDLRLADVQPPGAERFEHHVLRMQRVAVALVLDDSESKVLLLRRHRFINQSWGWEVPVGIVESGETAEHAAYREVEEETGWRPRGLQHVLTFQPAIGISDSPHDVFSGVGGEHVTNEIDPSEAAAVRWTPVEVLMELIGAGEIRDAASLVAILHLLARDAGS